MPHLRRSIVKRLRQLGQQLLIGDRLRRITKPQHRADRLQLRLPVPQQRRLLQQRLHKLPHRLRRPTRPTRHIRHLVHQTGLQLDQFRLNDLNLSHPRSRLLPHRRRPLLAGQRHPHSLHLLCIQPLLDTPQHLVERIPPVPIQPLQGVVFLIDLPLDPRQRLLERDALFLQQVQHLRPTHPLPDRTQVVVHRPPDVLIEQFRRLRTQLGLRNLPNLLVDCTPQRIIHLVQQGNPPELRTRNQQTGLRGIRDVLQRQPHHPQLVGILSQPRRTTPQDVRIDQSIIHPLAALIPKILQRPLTDTPQMGAELLPKRRIHHRQIINQNHPPQRILRPPLRAEHIVNDLIGQTQPASRTPQLQSRLRHHIHEPVPGRPPGTVRCHHLVRSQHRFIIFAPQPLLQRRPRIERLVDSLRMLAAERIRFHLPELRNNRRQHPPGETRQLERLHRHPRRHPRRRRIEIVSNIRQSLTLGEHLHPVDNLRLSSRSILQPGPTKPGNPLSGIINRPLRHRTGQIANVRQPRRLTGTTGRHPTPRYRIQHLVQTHRPPQAPRSRNKQPHLPHQADFLQRLPARRMHSIRPANIDNSLLQHLGLMTGLRRRHPSLTASLRNVVIIGSAP